MNNETIEEVSTNLQTISSVILLILFYIYTSTQTINYYTYYKLSTIKAIAPILIILKIIDAG